MTPIIYTIPYEETPEPGLPDKIEHGCDYMLLPDGKLEFHYNFIVYTWTFNGEEISARTYLDGRQNEVSVFVKGVRLQTEPGLQPLVRYLQRRFLRIESFHPDDREPDGTGYHAIFQHRRYREAALLRSARQ